MSGFPLSEFLVLYGLALLGALAILPYAFSLNRDKLSQSRLPPLVMALVSFVQSALLFAIAVGAGLLAGQPAGLGAPHIRAALSGEPVWASLLRLLSPSVGLGALSFAAVALLETFLFAPHIPEALHLADVKIRAWKRLLASFYGGIDEEILMRLFLVSGVVWVLGHFWQNASGLPASGAYWAAILLVSVLFGLGHLPATKAITPLTPLIVVRAVALNGLAGVAFGWLYWQYGLEAAMLSHFTADILLHLIAPVFLHPKEEHAPAGEVLTNSH